MDTFEGYVWEFYRPGDIYGDFFGNKLTKKHIKDAIEYAKSKPKLSEFIGLRFGDSFDREVIRDLMFVLYFGKTLDEVEHEAAISILIGAEPGKTYGWKQCQLSEDKSRWMVDYNKCLFAMSSKKAGGGWGPLYMAVPEGEGEFDRELSLEILEKKVPFTP